MDAININCSPFLLNSLATFLSTLASAVIAVQVQKAIERWREMRSRQINIFYNLMTTRGNNLSERHVEALNSISLEYHSIKKNKAKHVKNAWADYHAHLSSSRPQSDAEAILWYTRSEDLFINLLYEMAKYLGYQYTREEIKNGGYTPVAHGEKLNLEAVTKERLASVLNGMTAIKVKIDTDNNDNMQNKTP